MEILINAPTKIFINKTFCGDEEQDCPWLAHTTRSRCLLFDKLLQREYKTAYKFEFLRCEECKKLSGKEAESG